MPSAETFAVADDGEIRTYVSGNAIVVQDPRLGEVLQIEMGSIKVKAKTADELSEKVIQLAHLKKRAMNSPHRLPEPKPYWQDNQST